MSLFDCGGAVVTSWFSAIADRSAASRISSMETCRSAIGRKWQLAVVEQIVEVGMGQGVEQEEVMG